MRFATHVGAYEIDSVPSQPQVAHTLKTHQNVMLAALGYDYATCTVCASNVAQQRVLARAGWVRIADVTGLAPRKDDK